MKVFVRFMMVPLIFLPASSALALVDAEALVGKRWYTLGTDARVHVAAQEVAIVAHINPMPLVPVSFGVRLSSGALDKDDIKAPSHNTISSVDTATVTEAAIDFKVWAPMIPVVIPYARVTIPVYGVWKTSYSDNGDSHKEEAHVTGAQVSVGATYSPLPFLAVIFEINHGLENYKTTSNKVDGQGISLDGKSYSLTSNSVLVGAQLSL